MVYVSLDLFCAEHFSGVNLPFFSGRMGVLLRLVCRRPAKQVPGCAKRSYVLVLSIYVKGKLVRLCCNPYAPVGVRYV